MTAEEFLNQYDPSNKRSVSQEPASSVTSFLDQYDPSIKEPSGSSTEEPEPMEFFSFEDAVSAIGTIPEALAVGVPAAYQKLVTGLEIPEKSEAIESELAFQQRIQTEQADRVASGKATTFGSAIREALPSLGFSVLPMAAAIPAGIGGTMAGGPAAPVTGPAAAMAASGTVAYRMAGSDMMYRAYKQLEEAKGSPLTNEEKAEYYKTVLPIAQNYGLWEAGPEAVSNAITMGVGKFVFGFGKQAAKKLVGESIDSANKTIARKVAEKGAAVAGGLGTEIASEGVTSVGQYPEEAKIRQLAATGEVSQGEPPSYPGGYMQAVRDVAPATIALYGMMGTAAGGAKLSTLPFRSQKTPEQIAEDNINLEADRVSRELSIGETDEETKSINAALQTARNNLIAKKEVYTALEPNDPAAQSLGLEIREMEREVVALDNELKKRVGEPLSEPITEAERQQAELAKQIARKPAQLGAMPSPAAQTAEATYGAATGVYDVFGGITRKPVSIPKPAKLPTAPTIEEQTAERTYGGETGVFDVFAGARRKPVTPAVTPATPVAEAPAITPAPVAETPAVTEAPAAEVAPAPAAAENAPQRLIRSATESGLKPIKPREVGALRGFYTFQAKDSGSKIAFSSSATIAEESPNELNIEAIYTPPKERGTGSASRLLNEILSIADNNNITLKLEPKGISDLAQEGDVFLTKKQLASWYKRYGFQQETEGSDDILVRTPAVSETITPAAEVAPTSWIAPEQKLTPQESRALQVANLRGTEKRTGNITFVPEKLMTPQRLQSLRTEQESSGTLKRFPKGGKFIEIKMMGDVTGDPYAKGWAIIDRRPDLNRRKWIAQIPSRDERILAGSIANNESEKIVSAIKEGSITQERSNQLVDEAANNQIISSDFANNLKTAISNSTPAVSETITEPTSAPAQPAGIAVGNRIKLGKSPQTYTIEEVIPQSANDKKFGEQYYNVKNEKTGETQVVEKNDMKPVSSRRRKMASEPEPLPENERYGQVKLNQRIQKYFGGKIPDRVYVVDDAIDREKKYQAAYYPDLGILIVNNAYIKKNANVGDIIAHELGHYAFGDKKFKAAFDNFYNSLSPEDKAKIDKIIEESYNEETEQSQIEERNVIAFTSYTIVNPQRRSLWNAVLDALKAFANKVFGKNFQMSDPNRTALAMLATAKRRFAAGEEIVREDIQARKMAAQTQDARFAELEARAKAGDKEAEAEAQRMVDEAAKAAGLGQSAINNAGNPEQMFHGSGWSAHNIFERGKSPSGGSKTYPGYGMDDIGFWFTSSENQATEYGSVSQIGGGRRPPMRKYDVYLNIKNPLEFQDNKEFRSWLESYAETYALDETSKALMKQGRSIIGAVNVEMLLNRLRLGNKDGIIIWKGDGDGRFGLKEGESFPTWAIVFDSNQIKSADPFTYDDAGALIPLSERFQPATPDIRKMAARREQIMGEKVGPEVKTPEGIIAKTQELLRKQFDPTKVSEQNTTDAFRAIGRLTSKQGNAFAEELNDLGRVEGSEVSMGAALFVNDLFEYSIRLAADGQKMMLGVMMTNINKLPTGAMGATGAGQTLRARLELSQRFLTMAQAEQDAYTNYVAEFIYGPNPTKEQIQSIKDAYAKIDKTEPITEEELTDELEDVGNKTGTDLVGKIEDEIAKATLPTQNPIVSAMLTLQKLYGGTIETRYTEARESAQKIKEGVKKILTGGITNYRGKMVEGAASGLESGFWKTLSSKENKPGPLGELDAAQNRELGNIVKNMLISIGLKGTPPNTKMDIYEQVASILGEKQLSKDKIKLADEKIRGEINRKRAKEIEDTDDSDAQDAINLKYDAIEHAWDEAMARQLDMPISGSMLRRLIFNELKEDKTSIADLAKLMNEEPVIGASRQDRLVNSIITKIAGVTFEGQNPADYSALKEYLGNQLEALIIEKQAKGKAARAKEQLAKDAKGSVELQAEKAENEAQKQIERLAKIQSDTPSFPAEAQMNPVREAVKNALKLNLNKMFDPSQSSEIISNFKKSFVKELMGLGVKESPANILADVVGRQIEINSLNNQLKSIDRAIEKGPISEIVKAIKDTPLEDQQKPNWRYEVMRDYLRKAGLTIAQSERIAKLMDISLQKRFTMAQEQAFTDAISKSAPWKTGDTRSRRAFQKVLQALRAGALDPARNVLSDMAALNGWTGFTSEQYKSLLKNDAILSDPEAGELKKAEAYKAIQDVISKAKLPIRARNVIGQYYDAQALSGIPTLTVNAFSPIAFAMRNAIIEIGSGTLKGNPKSITNAATAFIDSIKSWANTVAFSFKNNVTVYSNVDYIVNDDNLLRLYRRGVDQFKGGKTARERADGVKNMMIGMMDYVRRVLNALDYGAIASLQNQNISKYSMAVMKRQGMSTKEANEMFGVMMKAKNDFYLQQIAIGTDKNKASILADEFYVSSWGDALTKAGVEKSDIKQAMDAAINDALSSVGRNRQSLDSLKDEATKLKDAGVSSMPALWLLESMANAANQSDSQLLKLFSRVIYGFAIVPARVIRETAWFSPYGFVRFGYDAIAKKMGKTSPYAQSLGTDVQYSQRLNEAIAGTVALIALASLRGSSTDEPKEDEFKIVFTGNGPMRRDDPQFYDSWYKAGNKPNSMIVSFGKTKFTFNMMRGFEAFTWPVMMLGALDDLEIRKKQKRETNTAAQLEDAGIVAGFVFDAALRRGPYAFTTKSLFGTYGDIGVEGVAKGLTFPAKTLIPVLGASLASNLSNFLNDPIDRRTLDGAVWSNIPFIGPAVAPKSLNAFGEPALSTDMASKMFKLGVPLVYDIPTDRESIKLHELVLKQGGGPSIPTRNQLAQRLDREPTNKEYEMFVKEYGAKISSDMKRRYEELSNKTPDKYSKSIEKIGNRARDIAERKVRLAAKKP